MRPLPLARRLTLAALTLTLVGGWRTMPQETRSVTMRQSEWRLHHAPESRLTQAVADFGDGLVLTVRCRNGIFETFISGLPPSRDMTRTLDIAIDGEGQHSQTWFIADDQTQAFSPVPAYFARRLISADRLQVRVPSTRRAPETRHLAQFGPSGGAVETALVDCGRPLADDRDVQIAQRLQTSLPAGLEWARRPRAAFPETAQHIERGLVTLTCVTQASRHLSDCIIESEYPANAGLGDSALSGMRNARVRRAGRSNTPLSGWVLVYTMVYRLE